MVRTVRKNRSFEQKQKRPNAHQVGRQFQVFSINKSREPMTILLKTQMLLRTNKEYRIAEFQQVIGGLLVMGTLIYIFGCCVYYFSVTTLKWSFLKFVDNITLGLLKSSPLEQFHSFTFWEVYERYSMGQPIIVGIIVILFLATGVLLSIKGEEKKSIIIANIHDEKLKKDYEKLEKKGSAVHDRYN